MSEKSPEETLMTTWADAQQKMLVGWLDLLQGTEQPSRKMVWSETVKAWQSTVQETLDAQARWLRDWTGRVQVTSGSPTELRKNVQQAQVLLLRWTEAQQHLWQGWFHLVQQLGPLLEAGSQADEHLLSSLQESGWAIINAQTEWVQHWTTDVRDPMTGSQGLVSVLHRNSVPQRRVQLWLHRTTHPSLATLGRLTSGPFVPSMPSTKRCDRPRTFYPIAAFSMGTRPFSWKGTV